MGITYKEQGNLRDGEVLALVEPPPVLRDITFNVAERGLRFIGIDLDELVSSPGVPPPSTMPKPSQYVDFLEVILENHTLVDLGEMTPSQAQFVVESLAAFFLFECKMALLDPKNTLER